MSENHLTRREVLLGMAAVPLLEDTLEAQPTASSICFTSTVEMARLIRAKKLSAREALVACRRESITAAATPKIKRKFKHVKVASYLANPSPHSRTNEFTATGH
jgi:hypothetical protein